jgi:hypothetical protein
MYKAFITSCLSAVALGASGVFDYATLGSNWGTVAYPD